MKLAVLHLRGMAVKRLGLVDEENERILRGDASGKPVTAPDDVRGVVTPRLRELLDDVEGEPLTPSAIAERLEELLDELIAPEPESITLEGPGDLATMMGIQTGRVGQSSMAAQHVVVLLPYRYAQVTLADIVEVTLLDLEAEGGAVVDDVVTAYQQQRGEDAKRAQSAPRPGGGRERLTH